MATMIPWLNQASDSVAAHMASLRRPIHRPLASHSAGSANTAAAT